MPGEIQDLCDARGCYYHLACGPGDLAPYILTCCDPARARRLAGHMDQVRFRKTNLE